MKAQTGDRVDQVYALEAALGKGAAGTVFRAQHRLSKRRVALKLLEQHDTEREDSSVPSADIAVRVSLAREFQTLASLHHPNVIQVLDYGFDPTFGSYFTMELVPQATTLIAAGENTDTETKVNLLAQLLRGLAYLHRRGVVHCDLKPSNVLFYDQEVKIVDFGVALEGMGSELLGGTPAYMAPELFAGANPSTASDLYAVGIIACELLTGAQLRNPSLVEDLTDDEEDDEEEDFPTAAVSSQDLLAGRMGTGDIASLLSPEDPLRAWVARLTAPAPEHRYPDALSALSALRTLSDVALVSETEATRESFLQAATLVGRERELQELFTRLKAARKGNGSGWLVGGESGVGKSRLLQEVHTQALVEECWVVRGQAVSEGGHNFEVWLPILRELCLRVMPDAVEASVLLALIPDLPELVGIDRATIPPPGTVSRQRLFGTLEGLFLRVQRPLVAVLEDLQWAGPDSLALLGHLAPFAARHRWLLLGTYRSDEAPNLPMTLPTMQVIALSRLDDSSIASLCTAILGEGHATPTLVSYLAAETEGNAFFLVEIVRALAQDAGALSAVQARAEGDGVVTDKITQILDRRLRQITGEEWIWLESTALLGRQVDLGVLQHLFPAAHLASWLVRCANAAILESLEGGWRFAHDKLRAHVVQTLDGERRKALHHDLASALDAVYTQREDKHLARAYHHEHAGELEPAVDGYVRAADYAVKLNADADARMHYAHAFSLQSRLPLTLPVRRQRVDILIKWAEKSFVYDPPDVNLKRIAEAEEHLAHLFASSDAPAAEDQRRKARILLFQGRFHFMRGRYKRALAYFNELEPLAQALGDEVLHMQHGFFAGQAWFCKGDFPSAIPRYERSVPGLSRAGYWFEWSCAALHLAESRMCVGAITYPEALAVCDEARRQARALRHPLMIAQVELYGSELHFQAYADYAAVLPGLAVAEAALRSIREPIYDYYLDVIRACAQALLRQKNMERPIKAYGLLRAMGGELVAKELFSLSDAVALLRSGQTMEALRAAETLAAECKPEEFWFAWPWAKLIWAEALALVEPHAHAAIDAHLTESLAFSRQCGNLLQMARAHVSWAEIARDRGDIATALEHAHTALAQYEKSECAAAVARLHAMLPALRG